MFKLILIYSIFTLVQCDLTNLDDILTLLKQNNSTIYSIGFMSDANRDVTKRYLPGNINPKIIKHKADVIKALEDETIIGNEEMFSFVVEYLLFSCRDNGSSCSRIRRTFSCIFIVNYLSTSNASRT